MTWTCSLQDARPRREEQRDCSREETRILPGVNSEKREEVPDGKLALEAIVVDAMA